MKTAKVSTFIRRNAALWPIVIMSVLLGIGFYLYPWVSDDINFRLPFRDYFLHGEPVNYADVWRSFKSLMNSNNSRLANLAMYHLVFLPQWLTATMSAFLSSLTIWLSLRLTNLQHSLSASLLLCTAFVLLMPWLDFLYVFNFQLNYLWAASLALVLSYLLLRCKTNKYLLFILGLIVGAWHESTSLPLMVGLFSLMIFHAEYRNSRFYATSLGLFIGLLWLWFSPGGKIYRSMMASFLGGNIVDYFFLAPIAIYLIICIRLLANRRLSAINVFLLSIGLTSFAVLFIYPAGPRILWFGDLASYIGIVTFIANKFGKKLKFTTLTLYLLMCIHLVLVDRLCYNEGENYGYIVEKMQAEPYHKTIYANMQNREDLPFCSLQKPYVNNFSHYRNTQCLDRFYSNHDTMHCVVPWQLEGVKSTDGVAIAGDHGFRYINGYIVGLSVADWPCGLPLTVENGGLTRSEDFYHVPFMTADGKLMAWYHPDRSSLWLLLFPRPNLLKFQ